MRWILVFDSVGIAPVRFCRALWMYRCRQGSVALALVLAWIANAVSIASFHCAAHALWDAEPSNPVPSLMQHFLIVPIGMVILMVPLFPGGAGIGELGFGGLYVREIVRERSTYAVLVTPSPPRQPILRYGTLKLHPVGR